MAKKGHYSVDVQKIGLEHTYPPGKSEDVSSPVDWIVLYKCKMVLNFCELSVEDVHIDCPLLVGLNLFYDMFLSLSLAPMSQSQFKFPCTPSIFLIGSGISAEFQSPL